MLFILLSFVFLYFDPVLPSPPPPPPPSPAQRRLAFLLPTWRIRGASVLSGLISLSGIIDNSLSEPKPFGFEKLVPMRTPITSNLAISSPTTRDFFAPKKFSSHQNPLHLYIHLYPPRPPRIVNFLITTSRPLHPSSNSRLSFCQSTRSLLLSTEPPYYPPPQHPASPPPSQRRA